MNISICGKKYKIILIHTYIMSISLDLTTINGFYINLESRKDRRAHVEKELKEMDINRVERFHAIKTKDGAVGCSMSHMHALKIAQEKDWDYVLICEDDIQFTNKEHFKTQYQGFIDSNIDWDVILIAGNVVGPYEPVNEYAIRVSKCQTTTGYIVKKAYYQTLIDNIKEGIDGLVRKCERHNYAVDQYWFKLQEKDNWYLITPLSVTQKSDYSNIENRLVKYDMVMLNLDKPSIFTNDPNFFKNNH